MPATRRDYANRLARACLQGSSHEDMEALVGLDLDVDWTMPVSDMATLTDLACHHLKDDLFAVWWDSRRAHDPSLTMWSPAPTLSPTRSGQPYVTGFLLDKRWSVLAGERTRTPGTPEQWAVVAQCPATLNAAGTIKYPVWRQHAQHHVPPDVLKQWDAHHAANAWLLARTDDEWANMAPKTPTPEDMLKWGVFRLASPSKSGAANQHEVWRFEKMGQHMSAVQRWSADQWAAFWNSQRPGLVPLYVMAGVQSRLPSVRTPIESKQLALLKNTQWSAAAAPALWANINESLVGSTLSGPIKAWKSWIDRGITALKSDPAIPVEHRIVWGVIQAMTSARPDWSATAVSQLAQNPDVLPVGSWESWTEHVDVLMERNIPATHKNQGVLGPKVRASVLAHMLKAAETNPDRLSAIARMIISVAQKSSEKSPVMQRDLMSKLVGLCAHGAATAPAAAAPVWASVFWHVLLAVPSMQPTWLAKASAQSALHSPPDPWDTRAEALFAKAAQAKRVSSGTVRALAEAMILHQAVGPTPQSGRATRRM